MTEWVEIEPVCGCRTWALACSGVILEGEGVDVDETEAFWDD